MSTNIETYGTIKSGMTLGTDKAGNELKYGDYVMYTYKRRVCFGRVVCFNDGSYVIGSALDSVNLDNTLKSIFIDGRDKQMFENVEAENLQRVSKNFIELWHTQKLFDI